MPLVHVSSAPAVHVSTSAAAALKPAPAQAIRLSSGPAAASMTVSTAAFAASTAAVRAAEESAKERKLLRLLDEGDRAYFQGNFKASIADYSLALKIDPRSKEARLNGALVWKEEGSLAKAREWLERASAAFPDDPKILTVLGWVDFSARDYPGAEKRFQAALTRNPKEVYALLGLGRVELETNRPASAASLFSQAGELAPLNNLAVFWRGKALEAMGDFSGTVEAYKQAASNDYFFVEARYALGRFYLRNSRFQEAARQFSRVLEAEPENRGIRALFGKVRTLWTPPRERPAPAAVPAAFQPAQILRPPPEGAPALRIGVGTSPLGKPEPRKVMYFQCSTLFDIVDAKTSRLLASGAENSQWQVRSTVRRKSRRIEVFDPEGRRVVSTRRAFRIRPNAKGGLTALQAAPFSRYGEPRRFRGEIEISRNRSGFKTVNVVDLESYVNGVLLAEMPSNSPEEALKAQSVIARTNALYLSRIRRRHRKNGYDLCDRDHCQVYGGAGAETDRSRSIVESTRGRIMTFRGKPALALYSANCGGHTQGGGDLKGWGKVEYWKGIQDAPPGSPPPPRSPWELYWWLRETPPAYCMPSGYVQPSHYRWVRVIAAGDLQQRLNRKKRRIGRIMGLRLLRRSPYGHLNSVLVLGSRKNLKITDEAQIRGLLAAGSQRSTLFVLDTEYAADGRPETFVFHGGGWGHGVGLCQSGAIGRAQQGQTYQEMLKAYYQGVEISLLGGPL